MFTVLQTLQLWVLTTPLVERLFNRLCRLGWVSACLFGGVFIVGDGRSVTICTGSPLADIDEPSLSQETG